MSDILKAYKLITAIKATYLHLEDFEDVMDDIVGAEGRLERVIMSTPASTLEELQIKFSIWRIRIEDPACLQDHDVPCWDELVADVVNLVGSKIDRTNDRLDGLMQSKTERQAA